MRGTYAALVLGAVVCAGPAPARHLDYIDADGITETGGPGKARMIPRTGPDGRLSSSLIPLITDATAVSGVAYVSATAEPGGNGSAARPFNTLQQALASVGMSRTVILTAGTYAGSVTAAAGASLVIVGCGHGSVLSQLTYAAVAGGTPPELVLVNVNVQTLHANNGPAVVRLLGSSVGTLAGTGRVTVRRADMGARYAAAPGTSVTDVYDGYDTIGKAMRLVNVSTGGDLVLSGYRAHVGDQDVAYLTDVVATTNGFSATLDTLSGRIGAVNQRVQTEMQSRMSADTVLSNSINAATADLRAEIQAVDTGWASQVRTLTRSIATVATSVGSLARVESNDVARLQQEIQSVPYAAADTALGNELRTSLGQDIVRARQDAVADAAAAAAVQFEAVNNNIADINDAIDAVYATINEKHADSIEKINAINTWKNGTLATWQTQKNAMDVTLKEKINAIVNYLTHKFADCNIQPIP